MPRSVRSIIGLVVLALVVTACGDTPPPSTSPAAEESPSAESPAAESPAESAAPTEEAPSGEGRWRRAGPREPHLRREWRARGSVPGRGVRAYPASTSTSAAQSPQRCSATRGRWSSATSPPTSAVRCSVGRHRRPDSQHDRTVSRDTSWCFRPTTFYDGRNHGELDLTEPRRSRACWRDGLRPVRNDHELNLTDRLGD